VEAKGINGPALPERRAPARAVRACRASVSVCARTFRNARPQGFIHNRRRCGDGTGRLWYSRKSNEGDSVKSLSAFPQGQEYVVKIDNLNKNLSRTCQGMEPYSKNERILLKEPSGPRRAKRTAERIWHCTKESGRETNLNND